MNIRLIYYISTILFVVPTIFSIFFGITRNDEVISGIETMGYPIYLLDILVFARVIGIAIILQKKSDVLREWGYAGFMIEFLGLVASYSIVGAGMGRIIVPFIMIIVTLISYFSMKKYSEIRLLDKSQNKNKNQ